MDTNVLRRVTSNIITGTLRTSPANAAIDAISYSAEDLRAGTLGEVWEYDKPRSEYISLPAEESDLPLKIRKKVGEYYIESAFVAEIRDAQIVGPLSLTIAEDGKYVMENALRENHLLTKSIFSALTSGLPPARCDTTETFDVAVSMAGPWSKGYFHWFADWLPRLAGIDAYTKKTGRDPILLLPPNPPDWMLKSLDIIGYGPDARLELAGERISVNRLVVPSIRRAYRPGYGGYLHDSNGFRWIRSKVLSNTDTSESPTGPSLYISRSDAKERRIINEKELMRALEPLGFEPVLLTEYTFKQQVRIIANADRIVAPHGAGLVNMIYGSGLEIIELFGDMVNPCYFALADSLDFEYGCRVCQPTGSNLKVDPKSVISLIQTLKSES